MAHDLGSALMTEGAKKALDAQLVLNAVLHCGSAMRKAEINEPLEIGGAHTHNFISSAPINLDRAIRLRDSPAGKHDVVHVPCHLPMIFRL